MGERPVIVVDPADSSRELAVSRLTAAGYETYACAKGTMALEQIEQLVNEGKQPFMVIADAKMSDGVTSVDLIKGFPSNPRLPVIVISNDTSMQYMLDDAGVSVNAVMKPADWEEDVIPAIKRIGQTRPPNGVVRQVIEKTDSPQSQRSIR